MGALLVLNTTAYTKTTLLRAKDLIENTVKLSSEIDGTSNALHHRGAAIGMSILAAILLVTAGLSTGLILAICGLDQAWLKMKILTDSPRERKRTCAVARMKSHGTWMLCSLVFCTVACSEYFPFVIQSIFPGSPWISILISTFCITIFVELIPQCVIPARPLLWGYYCRSIIWTCMWLTAIVSWPIAFIFNHISMHNEDGTVYSNDELKAIIKYHTKAEKNGGNLGPDASRIIIGSLDLDSKCIKDLSSDCIGSKLQEKDLEGASSTNSKSLITQWNSVKTVNISDKVNEEFIKKIRYWSYTRIPVIERSEIQPDWESIDSRDQRENFLIYGFIHIKSLIGRNYLNNNSAPLVRDLPIHPLPIIQEDMSVYALLNILELGISKMAIVVPTKKQDVPTLIKEITLNVSVSSRMNPIKLSGTRAMNYGRRLDPENDLDNLSWVHIPTEAASSNRINHRDFYSNPVTKLSRPIGLVTMDDLINKIFRKGNLDGEKCSDHNLRAFPQGTKRAGNSTQEIFNNCSMPSASCNGNELRQRKGIQQKKNLMAIDGADEYNLDHDPSNNLNLERVRNDFSDCLDSEDSKSDPHKRIDITDSTISFPSRTKINLSNIDSSSSSGKNLCFGEKITSVSYQVKSWKGFKGSLRCASAEPIIPVVPHRRQVTSLLHLKHLSYKKAERINHENQISKSSANLPTSLTSLSCPEICFTPVEPRLHTNRNSELIESTETMNFSSSINDYSTSDSIEITSFNSPSISPRSRNACHLINSTVLASMDNIDDQKKYHPKTTNLRLKENKIPANACVIPNRKRIDNSMKQTRKKFFSI